MPHLRILNGEPGNYSPQALAILESLGMVTNGPLTRAELLARIPGFDILIVRLAHQIDRQIIDRAVCMRVIVTATTGLDHIDVACAQSRGIQVLSLRGEVKFLRSIPATAEHTWALLLALLRHIPNAHRSVLTGEWDRDRFTGSDLAGKTLGIMGLGRIGEKVAHYGLAFGMRVIAFDPYLTDWPGNVERVRSLSELLGQSTIFSIHIPLDENTQGIIGAAELAQLPPGAVLLNTSRGQLIDEAALLDSLKKGHLSGAALDVICNERTEKPELSNIIKYARTYENLLITPHIGGATVESMAATEIFMAQKLKAFLENSDGIYSNPS